MKKSKKTAMTAAMFAISMSLNACGLYGPPNSIDDLPSTQVDTTVSDTPPTQAATSQTVAATTDVDYSPEEDEPQDVYGPPEMFDKAEPQEETAPETTAPETDAPVTEEYTPERDHPQVVYGPPEFFTDPETVDETFAETTEAYDPSRDLPAPPN